MSLGQLRVLLDREDLTPERIATLTPLEQERLEELRAARAFGTSLGLADSTGYRHLLDRDADAAVRVVVGAPPDRLEAVSWWFPIVGRVSYRGYFDANRADAFAASLAADGYDTLVRPAALYSTLGWFDDPVPRPVLSWDEIDVVDAGLHELVHETIFVRDDLNYNEALATFLAQEATIAFFADRPELQAQARAAFADRVRFAQLIDDLAIALEELYERVDSPEAAREARAPVFRRFQTTGFTSRGFETHRYGAFPELELDNAYVVAQQTYLHELACLRAWFEHEGGDLSSFIAIQRDDPGERPELEECQP